MQGGVQYIYPDDVPMLTSSTVLGSNPCPVVCSPFDLKSVNGCNADASLHAGVGIVLEWHHEATVIYIHP